MLTCRNLSLRSSWSRVALSGLATFVFCTALCAQFDVASVVPANEARNATAAANVVLTFNANVNPATVTATSVKVAGRWSGPVPGTLSVSGAVVTFTPSRPYFIGERVIVLVSSAVQSMTAQPVTGGFASAFWVKPKPATGAYVLDATYPYRLPGEGSIRTYGFFAGDIDRDGTPDMTATNEVANDIRTLKNDGFGNYGPTMVIYPMSSGAEPSPNEGADMNGDGYLDLVTGNQGASTISVFINDTMGGYLAPVDYPNSGSTYGVALLDVEGDGDMDVAASNFTNVRIFKNNGAGVLSFFAAYNGGSGEWQVTAADANNDGWTDLMTANNSSNNVSVLLNNGAGVFTMSATRSTGGFGPWAIGAADIDGDGNVDLVATNNGSGTAALVRGNGSGGLLTATTYAVGSAPVSVDFGDFDGDGDLDLAVANFGSSNATIYTNTNGTFGGAFSLPASQAASCCVIIDHDRDGDLDIVVTDELADEGRVYRRTEPAAPGVQAASAGSQLRWNQIGGHPGFAGEGAAPLKIGENAFLGVSGANGLPFILALGFAADPGAATAFGTLNLIQDPTLVIVADGFSGNPAAILDANGEAQFSTLITPIFPVGLTITLQAAAFDGLAVVLSNPVTGIVTL